MAYREVYRAMEQKNAFFQSLNREEELRNENSVVVLLSESVEKLRNRTPFIEIRIGINKR
jgi:hypothetical protein